MAEAACSAVLASMLRSEASEGGEIDAGTEALVALLPSALPLLTKPPSSQVSPGLRELVDGLDTILNAQKPGYATCVAASARRRLVNEVVYEMMLSNLRFETVACPHTLWRIEHFTRKRLCKRDYGAQATVHDALLQILDRIAETAIERHGPHAVQTGADALEALLELANETPTPRDRQATGQELRVEELNRLHSHLEQQAALVHTAYAC